MTLYFGHLVTLSPCHLVIFKKGEAMRQWIILASLGLMLLSAGCTKTTTALVEEEDEVKAQPTQMGMNLASVIDWSREWPLVDTFKASRPWMYDQNEKIEFDRDGYPKLKEGQRVSTLMHREIEGQYPSGTYVVTYEGKGKVEVKRWDVTRVISDKPGRIEVEVKAGDGGIALEIPQSDPNDPIRNIHCWMPGHEKAKSPFHPKYTERLQPFKVLRFMDWQRTNNSKLVKWADRPKMSDVRYSTDNGTPVELMVELANETESDPWFCMPHLADDDYVRNFAKLVKEKLARNRKVYVEYSNEVWNSQFEQARYAAEQGKKVGLSKNDYQAQLYFYSKRSVDCFKIWEAEMGKDRLVRVMAAQSANPWTSEQVLTYEDAYKHCDALAIAPYFGNSLGDPAKQKQNENLSLDQVFAALKEEVEGSNKKLIAEQGKWARKYKLQLVAYEGGQHLVGYGGAENNAKLMNLFIEANRDPRMGELYKTHLKNWFDNGGGLYVVFSFVGKPSKWGSWGVLEAQDQPAEKAPKYKAIVDFAKEK